MAKRMLVDATHPEETRVVVVNGNRLEDLDFEIATRKQLKGNIYLAKVTRVEPSLQAAFVEYGGNRHGFLAFSEIHPDYYRIPVADREALLAEERRLEEQAEARAEAAADGAVMAEPIRPERIVEEMSPMPSPYGEANFDGEFDGDADAETDGYTPVEASDDDEPAAEAATGDDVTGDADGETSAYDAPESAGSDEVVNGDAAPADNAADGPDVIGGDEVEEAHRRRQRPLRSYKIQEVVKRRQVMLVQVTKEERGNKGAALTTYLSLPGRYCVLMPNTGRGGGISRKITNPADRKRLKEILSDLDIPDGMAVILRTAGLERSKQEIKRDLEYLLRLWDDIREQTLKSSAPCLIYEEANLIKRSIRDLYADDIDEVWVEGDAGFRTAKDFMRMLMPTHTKRVLQYRDETIPLFHRYQVETQIDAIHSPVVQLRSGGYIVINPTEALVSIDVNSGKSTRERNIEETAYKTNLEAAEEVARQLRLRDLAGLIVIDFIDMEEPRNNASVERRLKEAMKNDRARIQLGRISAFGLLELSRQRLRPSLLETNFERCPHCAGTGVVRSVESAALHVLRAIEEEGIRKRSSEITVHVASSIALYILNQKRSELIKIEERYRFRVMVQADDTLIAPDLRIERIKARTPEDDVPLVSADRVMAETDRALAAEPEEIEEETEEEAAETETAERADAAGEGDSDRRRGRRRRRRGRGRDREEGRPSFGPAETEGAEDGAELEGAEAEAPEGAEADAEGEDEGAEDGAEALENAEAGETNGDRKKRRRGKRGGRRRTRQREDGVNAEGTEDGASDEAAEEAAAPADTAPAPVAPVPGAPAQAAPAQAAPAQAADVEPIDFDWILTGEAPAEEAPTAEPVAEAVPEAPAKKRAAPRKRKAAAEAPAEAAPAVVEPVAEAPVAEEAKPAKKRAAPRKRKAAAEAPAEAAPAVAEPVAEAPVATEEAKPAKKRAAPRKRKAAAEAPAEAAPAPAISEPAPEPVAAEPAVEEKAAPKAAPNAAEPVNPPAGKPKRGWWNR